jgi:hypothetical protein
MHNTFAAVIYPGIVGIAGVFFAHFTLFHAFIMYIISTAGGAAVSAQPFLKKIGEKKDPENSDKQ